MKVHREFVHRGVLSNSDKRQITVLFLNEKPAAALNKKFRKKNYATDVLSFSENDLRESVFRDPSILGELVLCPQVIAKQAVDHGLTFRQELGYMLIHGWLHLLGYDHEKSPRDAKKMFDLQDAVFERLLK